jgi:hypothetical protein
MNSKFEDGSWASTTVEGTETSAERDNNAPTRSPGPEAPANGFGNTWAC